MLVQNHKDEIAIKQLCSENFITETNKINILITLQKLFQIKVFVQVSLLYDKTFQHSPNLMRASFKMLMRSEVKDIHLEFLHCVVYILLSRQQIQLKLMSLQSYKIISWLKSRIFQAGFLELFIALQRGNLINLDLGLGR